MDSMDGRKKKKLPLAKIVLPLAMLVSNSIDSHATPAGRREVLNRLNGPKVSDILSKPGISKEEKPDSPPEVQFRIKED